MYRRVYAMMSDIG